MDGNNILSVIGGLFLAYHGVNFTLQVLHGVRTFLLPSLGFKKNLKSFGTWAVITGSTDGIGKSYAKQLAKQGMNIVLISRNLDKLKLVEEEIKSNYNVQTKIIVKDFSGGLEIYQDIGEQLKDLDIGILVNNVGVGVECPDYFTTFPKEETLRMLNVNILSVVMMTYTVLPLMVLRKRGLIINISSLTGAMPNPLVATYSSTKVFVDYFSQCLDREYRDQGISVQCVMPAFVSTNMTYKMRRNLFVPSSDAFVSQALGTIGLEQRTFGYWSHALTAWALFHVLPSSVRNSVIWKLWFNLREQVHKKRKRREEREKSGHKD